MVPYQPEFERKPGAAGKTERRGGEVAVERQGAAGERAAPERGAVEPAREVAEPLAVAVEHLDEGEQVVVPPSAALAQESQQTRERFQRMSGGGIMGRSQ